MCGFVAEVRFGGAPVDTTELARMRDAVAHRGPDDAALWIGSGVGLAFRRLAIVDLTPAGRQPMSNEDGTLRLLFNGEIYNYVELTAELKRRGHRFSSRSDGEVILHLYEELGPRCLELLNGMFAFVIHDARTGELFGARDRLGIKPFHYFMDFRRFICASEIKSILSADGVTAAADPQALADILFAGYPAGRRTPFAGIRQLEPGHWISVRDGRITVREWWDLRYAYRDRNAEDAERELANLLEDAVRVHCRSDAALGCHLSGGLDSSTVVALAARFRDPLPTFSIRFGDGGAYDETHFARLVARHTGARSFEDVPDATDFFANLRRLVWHMEMPLPNTAAYAYFTGSRLAARHVKVSLTGHGGDEVFGGYAAQFLVGFGRPPWGAVGDVGPSAPPATPRLRRWLASYRRRGMREVLAAAGRRLRPRRESPEQAWLRLHCGPNPARRPLLHPDFARRLRDYDPAEAYLRRFREAPTDELFDRCLYHDLRTYLPSLLHAEDRASMAVSLESRVPLLDYRVVEFMATVPPARKVPGLSPKGLLRRTAIRWLPDEVRLRRDKAPFPVPMNEWLRSPPTSLVRQVLTDPACLDRGVLDPDLVRQGRLDPDELWTALNLELWYRVFIDGAGPGEPDGGHRARRVDTLASVQPAAM